MNLNELVAQVSGESLIDKKVVRDVITSTLNILKESIESSEANEKVFGSPILSIRRRFIPEAPSTEKKEAIPARKRGIIVFPKKESES